MAYALKITDLDPLAYDLLFERFLNPERVSMPDFDIDFCMDGRDKVIDYVARTYGRNQVSQIITYGSMAAKAVVRDVGRVLGHPYGFVDRIAKLIPFTIGITLQDALGISEKSKKDSELISPDLIELSERDEEVKSLLDLAISLEGLSRNTGKHAGGVLISPDRLDRFHRDLLRRKRRRRGLAVRQERRGRHRAGQVRLFGFAQPHHHRLGVADH